MHRGKVRFKQNDDSEYLHLLLIRYCGADGTHDDITCDDGQIVIVNYAATEDSWLWMCGDDDGRCPGAFQVGCEPDDNYPDTTTTASSTKAPFVGICNQMKNPLGTCDCPDNPNQLWISADCTEVKSFFNFLSSYSQLLNLSLTL